MYLDILTESQKTIIPHFEQFTRDYYMVGGTAIALHIGHRKSVDFDLFTHGSVRSEVLRRWMDSLPFKERELIHEDTDQVHMLITGVWLTFFSFPYAIKCSQNIHGLSFPPLLTLAAMKAFALGRRAKWKDYVDIYFLLQRLSLRDISQQAEHLFGDMFSDKTFKTVLNYFDDIDYSETVEYLVDPVPEERIKYFLTGVSTDPF